jgi:dUTP pyrophosphatase
MDFVKVRDVISPSRANKTDAGIDFYIPFDVKIKDLLRINPHLTAQNFVHNKGIMVSVFIKSGERILIPSGIHVKLPKKHALIAFNKSGIAHKTGLVVGSQVVDEGYEGEIHISIINTATQTCKINAGAKIVQFICLPVNYTQPKEIEEPILEFYQNSKSTRGVGGFGSTNNK